jgi:hypothetical protein
MRRLILSIISLLSFFTVYAQQYIQVTDLRGQPIPLISIGIKGKAIATISNQQGQFLLQVRSLPDTVVFNHLSYLSQQIVVTDTNRLTITLKPQVIELAEVVIGDPVLTLMKQAADNAYKTATTPYFAKAFSKQIMTEGNRPAFFAENFLDLQWQSIDPTSKKNDEDMIKKTPYDAAFLKKILSFTVHRPMRTLLYF